MALVLSERKRKNIFARDQPTNMRLRQITAFHWTLVDWQHQLDWRVCVCVCVCVCISCSVVSNFVNSQTTAHQAHLSMGFPRQEHWSR